MSTATASVEDRVRDRFVDERADHEMDVIRDDGLYRHLRFRRPDTITYWFDLLTWPGVLTVTGDCGTFVFSRIEDMFEFFASARGEINPQYWAEKLRAPAPDAVRIYSPDAYRARVGEWVDGVLEGEGMEDDGSLRAAVDERLLGGMPHSRDDAIRRLYDFEHRGVRVYEPYDWRLDEWEYRFLWCCHAIVWGIKQYREAKADA